MSISRAMLLLWISIFVIGYLLWRLIASFVKI